ncbi:MAG TPA: hypothetical protein VJP76_08690 [Candidatus Tumulicola sp.]|nr:hypothetical protein [Candidatus Tumulicola sp.]
MKPSRSTPLLPTLEHVAALSDGTGIIQHAVESIPNRATGYCTDDVARAFIVALMRLRLFPRDETAMRLASIYLAFLYDAQLPDGRFHNFMSYERAWLDEVGTQDSIGRAMWALGFGIRFAPVQAWRRLCRTLFDRGLRAIDGYDFSHPRAYTILGLAHAYETIRERPYAAAIRYLGDALLGSYRTERAKDWEWFAPEMTYDCARLPEALIRAGSALDEARYARAGIATLDFYENVTLLDGTFVPIGNHGWYARGGERAIYAQQPLEAAATIDAELAAYDAGGEARRLAAAELALAWYYGKNSRSETMAHGGGCYDGLDEDGVNHNMGAESTLALLAGAYAMGERQSRALRAVNR